MNFSCVNTFFQLFTRVAFALCTPGCIPESLSCVVTFSSGTPLPGAHDSPRPATMPPTSALPSPLTTKPRSAFMRLRVVPPPPQAPPSSASDWTALLAAALPNTYGDADGSRFAFSVLSVAPEERPGEAVAVVQVRAGEERRVWAALTLATHWAGRPVRVDVVGVAAWGMGSGVLGRRIGWAPPLPAEGTPGVGAAMDVGGV